jgi:hypothetical protein
VRALIWWREKACGQAYEFEEADLAILNLNARAEPRAWDCLGAFHATPQHASVHDLAARFAGRGGAPLRDLGAPTDRDLEALRAKTSSCGRFQKGSISSGQPPILDASDTERLLGACASSLDTMIEDTLRNRGGNGDAS